MGVVPEAQPDDPGTIIDDDVIRLDCETCGRALKLYKRRKWMDADGARVYEVEIVPCPCWSEDDSTDPASDVCGRSRD